MADRSGGISTLRSCCGHLLRHRRARRCTPSPGLQRGGSPTTFDRLLALRFGSVARDLILPNGALVAGLIAWMQLLAGVMLIAGFRTRWAALAAGAISASLAAAAAIRDGGELRGYLLLGIIALAVMLGDAGRTWGLDGWRSERRRDLEL